MRRIIATALVTLVAALAGCGSGSEPTTIAASVAENAYEGSGLTAGSPLAGAELRLYAGDTVIFETTLGPDGTAAVEPEPGIYTVQVDLPDVGGCFWGETVFDVAFPHDRVEIEAFYICPGGE